MDLVLLSGEEFNHEVHEGSHEVTQRRMLSCSLWVLVMDLVLLSGEKFNHRLNKKIFYKLNTTYH